MPINTTENEDVSMPDIPVIADLTNAKIVGIDKTGASALFSISNIKGDFKGVAAPADAAIVPPALASFWIATTAGNYVNKGGVVLNANSFGVISFNNGVYTINQTLITYDLSGYATIVAVASKLDSSYLFNYTNGNLVAGLTASSIWSSASQVLSSQAGYQAVNILPASPSAVFVFTGLTSATLTTGNYARLYNSSGGYIDTLIPSALVAIAGGYKVTLPSTAGIAFIGFHFLNADAPNVAIYKNAIPGPIVKASLLPPAITDNSQIANGAGYVTAANSISKSEMYGVSTQLITSLNGPGIYGSTNSTPVALAGFTYSNLIPATYGQTFGISGLVATLSSGNMGRYFDAAGNVLGTILPSALVAITGGYSYTLPNNINIVAIGFNFAIADAPITPIGPILTPFVVLGTIIVPSTVKKSKLPLPEIGLSELKDDKPSISDTLAMRAFGAAILPKNYNTLAIGIETSGQSNQDGRIALDELPSWFTANGNKITDVLLCKNSAGTFREYSSLDFTFDSGSGANVWSYELLLFYQLINYIKGVAGHSTDKLYVVKTAQGSTSISVAASPSSTGFWTTDFQTIPAGKTALTQLSEKNVRIAAATVTGALYRMNCAIWHQGENDLTKANDYYQNLKNVIFYKRGYLGNNNLPIILGGINTSSTQYSPIIEAAKIKLATELPYVWYAAVSNGPTYLKADLLHFNAAGGQDLATSVYNIMIANKAVFGLPS